MHENLNTAISAGISCLYYKNNSYALAEDRALYYSFTLEKLPESCAEQIYELKNQDTQSLADYERREALFRNMMLAWLEAAA